LGGGVCCVEGVGVIKGLGLVIKKKKKKKKKLD